MNFSLAKTLSFLSLLSLSASVSTCATVYCSSSTLSCLSGSESLSLSPCQTGYYCPIDDLKSYISNPSLTNIACARNPSTNICSAKNAKTGHPCCDDSNCTSKNCLNGICIGKRYKDTCLQDSDCSSNMYCKPNPNTNDGYCTDCFTKGKDCDFDNECAAGLGCSRGSCTQIFSKEAGTLADQNYFCKTTIRNADFYCDSIEVYVNGKKLSDPFKCDVGDVCNYRFKNAKSTYRNETCQCDGGGSGYCGHYIALIKENAETFTEYIRYDDSVCTGDDASSINEDILYTCQSISTDQYNFIKKWREIVKYWGLYQSQVIDGCASDLGLFDPQFTISFGVRIIVGALIAIIQ